MKIRIQRCFSTPIPAMDPSKKAERDRFISKFDKYFDGINNSPELREEDDILYQKLLTTANERGVKVATAYYLYSPAFMALGPNAHKLTRDQKEQFNVYFRKSYGYFERMNPLDFMDGYGGIVIGNRTPKVSLLNSAAALAHELGHSEYFKKKNPSGLDGSLGKMAHILRHTKYDGLAKTISGIVAPLFLGMSRGGVDNNPKSFIPGLAMTVLGRAITSLPKLSSEYFASNKGADILRSLGASEEYMKEYKKIMWGAAGSYIRGAASEQLLPVVIYTVSYSLSKLGAEQERLAKEIRERRYHSF